MVDVVDDTQDSLLDSALDTSKDEDNVLADVISSDVGDEQDAVEDPELEAIKARVKEMEEEAEKLKEMQKEVEESLSMSPTTSAFPTQEEKADADGRSVYVGNVDYTATAAELEQHFHGCGSVNRVTILCDKFSGHPKGFAFIEFSEKDSIQNAVALNDSLFKGRQIKVTAKRTNRPGLSSTDRGRARGRGRGFRGGGGGGFGGGYYMPSYNPFSSYRGRGRGAYRGRRASWFSPY